jgi:hypothetical protein
MVPPFLHGKAVDLQLFPLSRLGWLVAGLSLSLHGRVNVCYCSFAGGGFLVWPFLGFCISFYWVMDCNAFQLSSYMFPRDLVPFSDLL